MKVLPLFAIAAFTISAGAQTATGSGSSSVTAPHTNVSQSAAAAASRSGVNEAGAAAAQSRHISGSAAEAGSVTRSATATRGSLDQAGAAAAQSRHIAGSAAEAGSVARNATATRGSLDQAGGAAAQSRHIAGTASQATNVSAKLTRSLDSKHARVGDPVEARTTGKALLADGTKLPKGTKLIGHVTEVSKETKSHKTSQLAFAFDHAILHNGRQVPIHAVLRSLSAPAPMTGADGDFAGDAAMNSPIMAAGGGGAVGGGGLLGGGGGLAGGGSALAGGALRTGGNVAGGSAHTLGQTTAGASAATTGEMNSMTHAGDRSLGGTLGAGTGTSAQGQLIPVGNLRGVSFSGASDSNSSAIFQGQGRNIDLSSGSTMSLAVSAQQ